MRWGVLTEIETYMEEIIEALDFEALNEFLYGHIRTRFTFEELVAQISINGLEALNKENICTLVFDALFYELSTARPMFVKMLLFALLFCVIQRLLVTKNKYVSEISFVLIYAALMVLLMQSFFLVQDIALEGINTLITFLQALIPTYAAALVFSGNMVSGAFLYEIAFLLIYLIELLMKSCLSPYIHMFILVLFLNHLFEEERLSKLAEFMENGLNFLLKAAFGAVIGLGVVQSLLTPVKDRLTGNMVLSGLSSIPGVGSIMGASGEIILTCGMLIKNSVGVIGLVLLFLLAVIPLLKLLFFWVMYQLLAIVLQPIGDKRIVECVSGVARGCNLYLKMVLYSMLLFLVLIAMVAAATSFVH